MCMRINPERQLFSPSCCVQVQLVETLSELGVRRDETASRANLRMEAEFVLLSYDSEAPVLSGKSSSTTSYDILDNPFATTVSEDDARRSEEHTSELQSLMRISYAVFCLKKKK